MSYTSYKHDALSRGEGVSTRTPDHLVPHYRQALWASRIALLVSILAAGLAFVGIIVSLICVCYSLR